MILHILPTTPPEPNGLAAYAHKLWQHWPKDAEPWETLAMRIPDGANEAWPEVKKHACQPMAGSLVEVISFLRPSAVVLHYVPHAYDKNGVPGWLVDGLSQVKQAEKLPIFTILHELFVASKPWRRSYRYTFPSRRLLTRLLNISDGWSTSSHRYYDHVVEVGGSAKAGRLIPIGSNIEPVDIPEVLEVKPPFRLAVFGLPETRERTIRQHQKLISALAKVGYLEKIHLIGASSADTGVPLALLASIAPGVPVEATGNAGEAEISRALAKCQLGLCLNPPDFVTKSGVYAAYCAHAVAPILPAWERSDRHPIIGVICAASSAQTVGQFGDAEELAKVRRDALKWSLGAGSWKEIAASLNEGLELAQVASRSRTEHL